jgi:hypothetical protein
MQLGLEEALVRLIAQQREENLHVPTAFPGRRFVRGSRRLDVLTRT